ncbi:MAG TPA: pyridoxamine 5'-phosphate oxidase family protein, partial [Ktedonobacteraceae bacterium]
MPLLDLTKERDAHINQRLQNDLIVWLTSVRPDGRPHSVAVWFLWDGEAFLLFSRPINQKVRNIQHNAN